MPDQAQRCKLRVREQSVEVPLLEKLDEALVVMLVNALPGICFRIEGSRKGNVCVAPLLYEPVPVRLSEALEAGFQGRWQDIFGPKFAEYSEGYFVSDRGAPVNRGAEDVKEEGFDVGEGGHC